MTSSRLGIDHAHNADLLTSFLQVLLIDTSSVCPKHPRSYLWTKMLESSLQVRGYFQATRFACDADFDVWVT